MGVCPESQEVDIRRQLDLITHRHANVKIHSGRKVDTHQVTRFRFGCPFRSSIRYTIRWGGVAHDTVLFDDRGLPFSKSTRTRKIGPRAEILAEGVTDG